MKKFLDTPLYFPRLYVDGETGSKLRELAEKGATVRIWSRIRYREITAENIIGILPGSKADEVILVTAHYDDWCDSPTC